jgi:citrate lyase subunit beta / citryl-CoA lyase
MRSLLFVPADSEKKFNKGLQCGSDALILDLEDSVALDRKVAARGAAVDFLKAAHGMPKRSRLYVRINAPDTRFWQADLEAIIAARPDGVMVPKPRSVRDLELASLAMDGFERAAGLKIGATKVIAIVTEVPESLLQMQGYVSPPARVEALTWGAEDLSASVGSARTRDEAGRWTSPYQLARNLTLMAASGSGRQAIDTVYIDFKNAKGFADECREAAQDGFTGKMAIHPDQVAPINAAFSPSTNEVAWAKTIVELFAANPGAGALSLDGQMIDRPHFVRAQRILARVA